MSVIRSMTGFASVQGTLPDGAPFTLSIKSVNHRFLDVHLRLPSGSDAMEQELRRRVKEQVERGHVEVTVELGRSAAGELQVNRPLLASLLAELRGASSELGIAGGLDLGDLLRLPGVLSTEARSRSTPEAVGAAVLAVLPEVLAALNTAREREGAELASELRAGLERLRAASDAVSQLRAGVRAAQFERLRARLQELLAGAAVSEERLLTEAGLLAEKSDVEEEAVRLRTHVERFVALLDGGGPVGKQLDFLLQELNREANTTLAKTGSAAGPDSLRITELGLAMKTEIERAREQVQNLE